MFPRLDFRRERGRPSSARESQAERLFVCESDGMGRSGGRFQSLPHPVGIDVSEDEASWLELVIEKLERLEHWTAPGWRRDAAAGIDAIRTRFLAAPKANDSCRVVRLTEVDAQLLDLVAMELVAEENPRALERGGVTWQTHAANDLADLAARVRVAQLRDE